MTQDEIIKMAKQAGFSSAVGKHIALDDDLERFAKLVAQHERERIKQANTPEIERINTHIKELEDAVLAEREACAKLCWSQRKYWDAEACADAIRARGQA